MKTMKDFMQSLFTVKNIAQQATLTLIYILKKDNNSITYKMHCGEFSIFGSKLNGIIFAKHVFQTVKYFY